MKFDNYIVNGKPLGFTSSEVMGQIITEVLSSYLPIMPSTCMFTGKTILTKPKIVLVDNNPGNFLFSNIAVIAGDLNFDISEFRTEAVYEFPFKGISVKCWKINGLDFFNENNLSKITKYVYNTKNKNPIQIFLDLISLGVKGLVYVSVETPNSVKIDGNSCSNLTTESFHYQDLISYRMMNPTNIVSA